jgi:ubiquitin carboxyl-terminal hydrolase 34
VEYKGNKMMTDDNLLHQLQKLFASLESSERSYIDPTEFCFSYKDFDGQPTNTAIQCDA